MYAREFNEMSKEEKKAFIHAALTSDNISHRGIIIGCGDDEDSISTIDIDALVKTLGIERVENMLLNMFENINGANIILDQDDINQLDEIPGLAGKRLKESINNFIGNSPDTADTTDNLNEEIKRKLMVTGVSTCALLETINTFQAEEGYDINYLDLLYTVTSLILGSSILNPDSELNKLNNGTKDVKNMINIFDNIAKDIEERLEKSWNGKKPNDEVLLMSLLTYAQRIVFNIDKKENKTFCSAKKLADFFSLPLDFNNDKS